MGFMIDKKEATGRYLCTNEFLSMSQCMDICDKYCEKHNIETKIPCCDMSCKCCWCLLMCMTCCLPANDALYLKKNINKGSHYSNAKIKKLGFEFRDNESTFAYTLDYLNEAGYI